MKPPIIVDVGEDVLVFDSVERVESYLEPIDVKAGAIRVFDSDGRLMKVGVTRERGPLWAKIERVRLDISDEEPGHEFELTSLLTEF
jgi:hypothetical protein